MCKQQVTPPLALPIYSVTRAFLKDQLQKTFTALLLPDSVGSHDPGSDSAPTTFKEVLHLANEASSSLDFHGNKVEPSTNTSDSGNAQTTITSLLCFTWPTLHSCTRLCSSAVVGVSRAGGVVLAGRRGLYCGGALPGHRGSLRRQVRSCGERVWLGRLKNAVSLPVKCYGFKDILVCVSASQLE